jgi:hypothetical protein
MLFVFGMIRSECGAMFFILYGNNACHGGLMTNDP